MNKECVFICDKGWRIGWEDRGGVSYLLKAYLEEFNSKDNVKLIVKINMSYGTNIDKFIEELNIKNKDLPKLNFITDTLEYKDLVKFYHMGDVFVCPSRAEGFGLGFIQAMACGLPVITTNFGGQTDFCNNKNSIIIGGNLYEVKEDVQYEGIKWLKPDIKELRKAMRYVYENQDKLDDMKKEALKTANSYTWQNSAKIAYNCLKE